MATRWVYRARYLRTCCGFDTKALHTAHHQPQAVVIHYPFHPLAGQTVTAYWSQSLQGVEHYRVMTPAMTETLVPTWMCHPATFDPHIVSEPVIALKALHQLHILMHTALSSSHSEPHAREEPDATCATTAAPLSHRGPRTRSAASSHQSTGRSTPDGSATGSLPGHTTPQPHN